MVGSVRRIGHEDSDPQNVEEEKPEHPGRANDASDTRDRVDDVKRIGHAGLDLLEVQESGQSPEANEGAVLSPFVHELSSIARIDLSIRVESSNGLTAENLRANGLSESYFAYRNRMQTAAH